ANSISITRIPSGLLRRLAHTYEVHMTAHNTIATPHSWLVQRSIFLLFSTVALCALMFLPSVSWAQVGGGLQRSVTVVERLREWAWLIIPIVCLISGGIAGVLYSMDIIRKDT